MCEWVVLFFSLLLSFSLSLLKSIQRPHLFLFSFPLQELRPSSLILGSFSLSQTLSLVMGFAFGLLILLPSAWMEKASSFVISWSRFSCVLNFWASSIIWPLFSFLSGHEIHTVFCCMQYKMCLRSVHLFITAFWVSSSQPCKSWFSPLQISCLIGWFWLASSKFPWKREISFGVHR